MSDDQLDNDLKNRIKQVFDDYQDDTANEGWLLLRKKYPEEEEDRAIIWWNIAGVAAFLLLALNIFFWFQDDTGYKKKIANIHKTEHIDSAALSAIKLNISKQDSAVKAIITQTQGIAKTRVTNPKSSSINGKSAIQPNTVHSSGATQNSDVVISHTEPKTTTATTLATNDKTVVMADSAKSGVQSALSNPFSTNKKSVIAIQQQPVVVSKAMQQLFDKEDKAKKNTQIQQTAANKFALGIYAASYINYAKGSQRQFNNGAGISSDIRLTDNLSISTGLAIGQNTLAYNGSSSPLPVALMATNSRNFTASASTLPIVVPSARSVNANLVNLDVPVNLKYNFNPQTGNTYFAAGLSSGTFINESYSTTYSYNSNGNNSVQQFQDGSHKSFDNFYFAQMLNLAFGLGYPLGKNQLVIEPFFKYPLNGLGDQHILFGSGGINLKFNFETSKSKK